ncbi:MAG: ribonuclease HI [Alphaproteobacteria bacterium]
MNKVVIYTDGACSGNPGKGGWGAVLIFGEITKEIYGYNSDTTNNRMELMAVIEALKALKKPCLVELYLDSQYVKNGITEWIIKWQKNGWKTADKKPIKNQDLWLELWEQKNRHNISWHWVKGHSNHPLNDKADELARRGIREKGGS